MRIALGADRGRLIARVVGQAMMVVVVGALAGIGGVIALGPLVSRLLQDVTPRDPLTLSGVVTVLLVTVVLSALVPADPREPRRPRPRPAQRIAIRGAPKADSRES